MTKHPLKDITFVHCTEKPHVFPSETSSNYFCSFTHNQWIQHRTKFSIMHLTFISPFPSGIIGGIVTQTQALLCIRGHRKKREYLSWHDFYTFLPTDLVLIHIQTPSDLTQTLPDTIQTPQDIDIVMQYGALKENAISEYHGLIYFLPTDLVLMPPKTPSDTIQTSSRHHPDTPRHRRFCNRGYWKKGQYPSMA